MKLFIVCNTLPMYKSWST